MGTLRTAQREALRAALDANVVVPHVRVGAVCSKDGQRWPCATTIVLTDLAAVPFRAVAS